MAKDWEDYIDEDECCLNCGEIDYQPSKTPGLCSDCMSSLTSGFQEELDIIDGQMQEKVEAELPTSLRLPTLFELRNNRY